MKNAILHGVGGINKDYFWFAGTKRALEVSGYSVWWPKLPNADKPNLQDALDFLAKNMPELGEEDVMVGHSSASHGNWPPLLRNPAPNCTQPDPNERVWLGAW